MFGHSQHPDTLSLPPCFEIYSSWNTIFSSQAGTFKHTWDLPALEMLVPQPYTQSLSQNWCLFCCWEVVWNRAGKQWREHPDNNASCAQGHKLMHHLIHLLFENLVHGTVLGSLPHREVQYCQIGLRLLYLAFCTAALFPRVPFYSL